MSEVFSMEVVETTAVFRFEQPERRNPMSADLATALVDACEEVSRRQELRSVIVTGAGSCFSAGGDVHRMARGESARSPSELADEPHIDAYTTLARRTIKAFVHLEVPIIAAINGPALGWGTDIALASDIRLATPGALLGESFVRLGAVSGTGGIFLLPRIVGLGRAAELLLTGRTISAQEALAIGMVNAVVESDELMPRAFALAQEIARAAPLAVKLTKRALYSPTNWAGSIDQALTEVMYLNQICLNSADHQEAAQAIIDERAAEFKYR